MSFRDNKIDQRFELDHDGGMTFCDYRDRDGVRFLTHVETPAALRGKGAASKLMDEIAAHARSNNQKLTPRCGYAVAWFQRHRDFADVLA